MCVPVSGSSTDSRFNMAATPIGAEELEDLREAFSKIGKTDVQIISPVSVFKNIWKVTFPIIKIRFMCLFLRWEKSVNAKAAPIIFYNF